MLYINLPSNTWSNIYSLASVSVGQSISVKVSSATTVIFSDSQLEPSVEADGVEVDKGDWITFSATALGAWARPTNGNASIAVATSYSKMSQFGVSSRAILYGNTIDRIATQALSYRDDAISRGLGYYAYHTEAIASGAKSYFRFQCPSDKYVVLLGRDITMNKEALIYRTYSAYTGGTIGGSIEVKNLRNDTAYPSTSAVNHIATPTPTPASEVTYLPLYGSVGSGNRVSGSTDTSDTFRLLAPNSVFLIEIENTSTSSNSVFFQFTWFELSQQVIL